MQPFITQLMNEHRFIEQVLTALGEHVRSAQPQPAVTAAFADFFRGYTDTIHEGKEEAILFRECVRSGFSRTEGHIAGMYHEHGTGRRSVAVLASLSQGLSSYSRIEIEALRGISGEFAQTLRSHIIKEDRVLFPLLLTRLPAQTLAALDLEAQARDAATAKAGTLAKYESLGRILIDTNTPKYGAAANPAGAVHGHA